MKVYWGETKSMIEARPFEVAPLGGSPWFHWEDANNLAERVADLEKALYTCVSRAGMADPADGCRAVIATVKDVMGVTE